MVLGVVGRILEINIVVAAIVQQHQRLIMVLHSLKRVAVAKNKQEVERFIMIGK